LSYIENGDVNGMNILRDLGVVVGTKVREPDIKATTTPRSTRRGSGD
jgi:hypothetical protein